MLSLPLTIQRELVGGSGGYNTAYVTVTPGSSVNIVVGAGGSTANNYSKAGGTLEARFIWLRPNCLWWRYIILR